MPSGGRWRRRPVSEPWRGTTSGLFSPYEKKPSKRCPLPIPRASNSWGPGPHSIKTAQKLLKPVEGGVDARGVDHRSRRALVRVPSSFSYGVFSVFSGVRRFFPVHTQHQAVLRKSLSVVLRKVCFAGFDRRVLPLAVICFCSPVLFCSRRHPARTDSIHLPFVTR